MLLVLIYYYKGFLSINDIQKLLGPIAERYFRNGKDYNLEDIYREAFDMEEKQLKAMKEDVVEKFRAAQDAFPGAPKEDSDFLHKFAFICLLGYDVYLKKLMIEKMIDELAVPGKGKEGKRTAKDEVPEE